ncbi:hypothetical protein [Thermostichus sp. MS-CIW-15]
MTALTPSRMRRLISSLVNLLSSSPSIPPSMLNPQNTRHYLSTWGLLRLKAEENALSQEGKKQVVKEFFSCLEEISGQKGIAGSNGLNLLMQLGVEEYLGLTGLGLALAQEFGFWATAIYHDVKGGE